MLLKFNSYVIEMLSFQDIFIVMNTTKILLKPPCNNTYKNAFYVPKKRNEVIVNHIRTST